MPHLEKFETILDYNLHHVYIATNHYSLLQELIEYVQSVWVPNCSVRYESGNAVELKQLNNMDIQIGNEIYTRLQASGWEIVESVRYGRTEDKWGGRCKFRRTERFTSVVDDLERLMEMLNKGHISNAEYEDCKHKLIS